MPANGLRVNHYDFVALHSMWMFINSASIIERQTYLLGTPVDCRQIITCVKK